jgi:hypothetical protein
MSRPFTDITSAKSNQPVKNGSIISSTTKKGTSTVSNSFVKNYPTINDIQSKYGYRYYNGMFVELVGNQTIVGA